MATNPTIILLDLLNDAPYGAYAVDLAQIIRFWNQAAEQIPCHKAENIIGRLCYKVVENLLKRESPDVPGRLPP